MNERRQTETPGILPAGRFGGHTESRRTAPHLGFAETTYGPGQVLRSHAHEHAHLCFVLEGSYTETIASGQADRSAWSLIFLPADCAHGETHSSFGRHFIVEISSDFLGHENECRREAGLLDLSQSRAVLLAARAYMQFRTPERFDADAVSDLISEAMAFCAIQPRQVARPAWLARTRETLRDRYRETVRLSELAGDAGVHPVHLAQTFRHAFGLTVGEEIRRLRLEHACRLLSAGSRAITEIALDTGFADQSHLSRLFRRAMGLSPGRYRRLLARP